MTKCFREQKAVRRTRKCCLARESEIVAAGELRTLSAAFAD
jgi:hypothetical protein